MSTSEEEPKETPAYNVFRHSPLRYMGYANEVGESFRYQFPRLVLPSYALAFGYCAMDAATTGYGTWTDYKTATTKDERSREMKTFISTFDTLLWQCKWNIPLFPYYSK